MDARGVTPNLRRPSGVNGKAQEGEKRLYSRLIPSRSRGGIDGYPISDLILRLNLIAMGS